MKSKLTLLIACSLLMNSCDNQKTTTEIVECMSGKISCWERVEKAGWTYFSIPDKKFSEVDSIRFIVSNLFNPQNPTIFFSQGSGNYPVLEYYDYPNRDSSLHWVIMPPFHTKDYVENYNFVVIAKPGTPICKPYSMDGPPPLIDTAFGNYRMFYIHDFLDYYVAQLNQVVDIIRKKSDKNAPFFFIGNSQGGPVVTTFAERHPKKVQRLILQATSILDRTFERVFEYRLLADKGLMSSEEAQERIDHIYEMYQWKHDYRTQFTHKYDSEKSPYDNEQWHYNAMNDAIWNFDIMLPKLQHLNMPILAVYGTADLKTRANDLLPHFFTRWGKKNLTMLPIIDADHTFVKTIIDKETNERKQEYIGDEVFAEIEKWLSK
jgi:pimeloyl-ACP methyl ester carboxylesterase